MIKSIFSRFLLSISFFAPFGYSLRPWLHRIRGVKMGKNVWIAKAVYLDELHPEDIEIGDNSIINYRTTVYTHSYFGPKQKKSSGKVIIGKDVYIGPHCLILPGVKIGDCSVIKGGTVLTRNVPPNTFWGMPNPGPLARVTVPLTPGHTQEEFVKGLRPIKKRERTSLE